MRHDRSRQGVWIGIVLIGLVLGAMSVTIIMPAHAAPQSSPTHKLLIRSTGEGTNYTVTVSGMIDSGPREQADRTTSKRVKGHVGSNDTVDAITYTGYITGFNASRPNLKATLDGTFLDASILDANHLRLMTPGSGKSSQPVRYTIQVSKKIVSGEGIENRDSPTNTSTVSGWVLPGDSDGFYFRGKIVTSTANQPVTVYVNGQQQSLGPTSRPTQTLNATSQSAIVTSQSSTTARSQSHTLVIKQVNGSVGYTATLSGTITLRQTEPGDTIAGPTVIGQVGGTSGNTSATDQKDVIHFTGKLRNFEYDGSGKIHVRLDGKQINPKTLHSTPPHPPATIKPTTPTVTTTAPTPTTTRTGTPLMSTAASPTPHSPTATPTAMTTPTTGENNLLRRVAIGLGLGVVIAGLGVFIFWRKFW